MSHEAEDELWRVRNWFGEELLTYVRIYDNLTHPHVSPLVIPDKILSREIAYQTVGYAISKTLKDSNKRMWPSSLAKFGIFSLANYFHEKKEILAIWVLNLPTMSSMQYDHVSIIKNFTASQNIR